MDPQMENHLILSNKDSLKIKTQKVVTNIIDLQNGKELISFFDQYVNMIGVKKLIKNPLIFQFS
jgi:hypothetical protein